MGGRRNAVRAAGLVLWLVAAGCVPADWVPVRQPRAVLHPQIGRVEGEAWLRPRHSRKDRPLEGPLLLEPDDTVRTGSAGRVEIRLPEAVVRLFPGSTVRVPFAYEGRHPVTRTLRVLEGEVLVWRLTAAPLVILAPGMELAPEPDGRVLLAADASSTSALALSGTAEARHVSVRGQTAVHLRPGVRVRLDRAARRVDVDTGLSTGAWRAWERGAHTGGLRPAPPPGTENAAPSPRPPGG